MLLPVPLSQKKYKSRGTTRPSFWQTDRPCAGYPSAGQTLIRNRNTEPQKSLGPKERYENLSKAFEISGRIDLKDKKNTSVDDIYTTGSTVEAAVKPFWNPAPDPFLLLPCVLGRDINLWEYSGLA